MTAILTGRIWLYPITDRRLVVVVARGDRFQWMPRFGFHGRNGKTYFIIGFGGFYAGARVVPNAER